MRRGWSLVLAVGLLVGCGGPVEPAVAAGPESVFEAFARAARRGDQAGMDALMDKPRVTLARQSRHDRLTGHGRWLKPPDATCAAWRPVTPRLLVDPDKPLSAADLAGWLGSGPGEPILRRTDEDTVFVIIPFGVTEAELELGVQGGRWIVVGAVDPTEVPLAPRFECARPRRG